MNYSPPTLTSEEQEQLLQTIELVAKRLNDRLRLTGVILCLFESGTRLAAEVGQDVEQFFARQETRHPSWAEACTFQTRIRRNIRLAEAPSFGQSILDYAPESHGAADYRRLAEEVHAREFAPSEVELATPAGSR